jgi:glycosidase
MFWIFGAAAGCSDDDTGPGSPCDGVDCGGHGICVVEGEVGVCECDPGYRGAQCGECADGYHREGELCVEDTDPYYGTPTIDGEIAITDGDWTAEQQAGTNDTATDWGDNVLSGLFVAYDDENFYIGIQGWVEAQNALAVYLDVDYGAGSSGLQSIAAATDNDGQLDNALSADITVTESQYKADMAVGTKGMASTGGALVEDAGWRRIGENPADFPWISGEVVAGGAGFEAQISFDELFGGAPPTGTQVALFARLVNEDGQHLANQTVPLDDPANPKSVSELVVIQMGGGEPICNDDGVCDSADGENFANCPGDCPATCDNDGTCEPEIGETHDNCADDCPASGLCGDPDVFEWADGVMYFVMTDRFYDSDGLNDPVAGVNDWAAQYQGGDWVGVEEKVPYLQDLGVNVIWLSAPYDNRDGAGAAIDPGQDPHMYSAYHGYWPSPPDIDYSDPQNPTPLPAVESRLGTPSQLHSLVDALHGASMYVIFDYVMNHVDIDSGLYAAHSDWFAKDGDQNIVLCSPNNWDDPYWGTRCAFTDYLPPFDFYDSTVRQWSVNDAIWWAREYNIDGYRLDAIKHVPLDWLTELRTATNAAFSDPAGGRFYMVGETYAYDDQGLIASFINPSTMLDGQFDFPLRKRICDTVFNHSMSFTDLFDWMDTNDAFYPTGTLMSTWIGNHDIPRAIHFASGQIGDCYTGSSPQNGWNPGGYTQPADAAPYEKLGLAFGILLTNPGIPLIYYGDEIGLAGGGDPDNRRMMVFEGLNTHQIDLYEKVKRLIQIRRQNVALRRGQRETVTTGGDTFAYKMTGCGVAEDIYVLVNRGDNPAFIDGLPAGAYTELLTSSAVNGGSAYEVDARSLAIFRAD